MPQYLSPGVYVEEVPPAARPIAGVGTSTAGFIGLVSDTVTMPLMPGRTGKKPDGTSNPDDFYKVASAGAPQLLTSWEQFKNNFGDFQKQQKAAAGAGGWSDTLYKGYMWLQQAVYGFFNNGGTRCWVIRVAAEGDMDKLADQLKLFESIDEIAIVAVPGITKKTQQLDVIQHCERMLSRVAVLDGVQSPAALTLEAIKSGGVATEPPVRDSSFAALYFPWIKAFDSANGVTVPQPPSGHIAGIYARVDGGRGVHKAPANEAIFGALDVDRKLSKADQEGLNPYGINVIRAFDGNVMVYGARTLGGDKNADFKYLSTRRLFNFMRKSIEAGTQWVVFEPNAPALWQRITRNVSDFLLGQWRDGALFGDTAKQAFYVKCDAETNPPDVRERGQVVTEIGVAIVKPAEFVIFRLQQLVGG